MIRDEINATVSVRGRVRSFRGPDDAVSGLYLHDKFTNENEIVLTLQDGQYWRPRQWSAWQKNDVLYSWGAIAARQLTQIGLNYRISGMYMEYKNVASPGDTVSPPGFDRSGGINYYDALSSSPDVDFLRVPMIASTLDTSNSTLFSDVNRMTFFAMSQGVVGANGKPYGPTHNSVIYGGGLIAIVDLADRTQDVVFSRFYFDPEEQMEALANAQAGLEWQIALT